jgi:hypothetical protein
MKHLLLLIAITAQAISQSAEFVDNSPTGNAISVAGSKDAKTGNCSVLVHNNDLRPAVAVVVDFDGGNNVARHTIHDHFFMSDDHVVTNGKDFDMSFPCADWKSVTTTTKLVQFNDGQLWASSDAKTVKEIAAQHRDAIDYLNEVLRATDVRAALATIPEAAPNADGTPLTARVHERYVLNNAADPIAAAQERLENANAHSSWLLNLK